MSRYRFLSAHFINNRYYAAGEIASTRDVIGGSLPLNWIANTGIGTARRDCCCGFLVCGSLGGSQIDLFRGSARNLLRSVPGTATPNRLYSLVGPLGVGFASQAWLFDDDRFPGRDNPERCTPCRAG